MHKFALVLAGILVTVGMATSPSRSMRTSQDAAVPKDNAQPLTVRGAIWDSACAAAGSHGKMMAQEKAKDVKECTLACIKAGSDFVLYNPDDGTTYRLDNQDKVKEFAGQTVTVSGNYDRATNTLHVENITS